MQERWDGPGLSLLLPSAGVSWVFTQVGMMAMLELFELCLSVLHAVCEGPQLLFDKGAAGTCAGGHFSRKVLLCSSCRRPRPCSPPCSLKCSLNMEQSRYSEAGGTVTAGLHWPGSADSLGLHVPCSHSDLEATVRILCGASKSLLLHRVPWLSLPRGPWFESCCWVRKGSTAPNTLSTLGKPRMTMFCLNSFF